MLAKLKPKIIMNKAIELTPLFLEEHGVNMLLLDIDGTFVPHGEDSTIEVDEWFNMMIDAGVLMCIVSNNDEKRVKKFIKNIKVDYVANAGKPQKKLYQIIAKKYNLPLSKICAIGDQLFTDIWGANRSGMLSVYVRPIYGINPETTGIRFKRVFEKILLKMWGISE